MRIRSIMTGSGTIADPYRSPLPSYRVAGFDTLTMRIIVDVDDEDGPDDVDAPGTPLRPVVNGVPIVTGLRANQKAAFRDKVRAKWAATHGGFTGDEIA